MHHNNNKYFCYIKNTFFYQWDIYKIYYFVLKYPTENIYQNHIKTW